MEEPLVKDKAKAYKSSDGAAVVDWIFSTFESYIAVVTWFLGWYGLYRLIFDDHSPAPYVFAVILASQVRMKPPLGQAPPVMDPIQLFIWPILPFVSAICFVCALNSLLFSGDDSTQYYNETLGDNSTAATTSEGDDSGYWLLGAFGVSLAGWFRRQLTLEYLVADAERANPIDITSHPELLPRPLIAKFHGYLYGAFNKVAGKSKEEPVHMKKIDVGKTHVYLWETESNSTQDRPVFLFFHGGGWKGGAATVNPHGQLMQVLATENWFVVSAEYRMNEWPQHVEDCYTALKWIHSKEAKELGADASRITISGASAGGHIASIVMNKAIDDGKAAGIRSLVLFYPALDLGDVTGATASLPFNCPLIKHSNRKSLLTMFFEIVILRRDASKWEDDKGHSQPLRKLKEHQELAKHWPPTFIAHGEKDSVVPIEASEELLRTLAQAKDGPGKGVERRSFDKLLRIPGGRHTYELPDCFEAEYAFRCITAWLLAQNAGKGNAAEFKPPVEDDDGNHCFSWMDSCMSRETSIK